VVRIMADGAIQAADKFHLDRECAVRMTFTNAMRLGVTVGVCMQAPDEPRRPVTLRMLVTAFLISAGLFVSSALCFIHGWRVIQLAVAGAIPAIVGILNLTVTIKMLHTWRGYRR